MVDSIPYRHDTSGSSASCNTRSLSDTVTEASKAAKSLNRQNQIIGLAQLRLTNLQLHGREEQLKLLQTKLNKLVANNTDGEHNNVVVRRHSSLDSITSDSVDVAAVGNNELILVVGSSGQGKSALVMKGLKLPAQKMGITFTMGKFDMNNNTMSLPFSAVVDAFSSLTKQLSTEDNSYTLKRIKIDICEILGEEDIKLVSHCLPPGCEELFPDNTDTTTRDNNGAYKSHSHTIQNDTRRLQYAFRRLLRAICSNLKGVLFFLDDLQWSDSESLELIKSLALARIPNLLIVGAYRNDEVNE